MTKSMRPLNFDALFCDQVKSIKKNGDVCVLELDFATLQLDVCYKKRRGSIELIAISDTDVCRKLKFSLCVIETRLGFLLRKGDRLCTYLDICKTSAEFKTRNQKKATRSF